MGLVDILSGIFRAGRKGGWVANQNFRTFRSYERLIERVSGDLGEFSEYVLWVEYYVGPLVPDWLQEVLRAANPLSSWRLPGGGACMK